METLKLILTFGLGVAAGAAVTWKIVSDKYGKLADEEIKSVKDLYSQKLKDIDEAYSKIEETLNNAEEQKYNNLTKMYNQTETSIEEKGDSEPMDEPYVIHPDDFGTKDDYDTEYLTYYADGVLADERDIPIDDVDSVVGLESLDHIGKYEEDILHVRNDELETDYEITADNRTYTDVMGASDLIDGK